MGALALPKGVSSRVADGDPSLSLAGSASGIASPVGDAGAALADADSIVAAMRRLAVAVAGDRAAGWGPADRQGVLGRLRVAIDGLATVRGSVLVAEKTSRTWKASGAGSVQVLVAGQSGESSAAVGREVRDAEQAEAVPQITAQVIAGTISSGHAKIIAALAVSGTATQRAAVASTQGQAHLLALARTQGVDLFAITVKAWAATIDPAGLERDHDTQRAARFFHLTPTPEGTYLKGRLDTVAGRHLILALEAFTTAPSVDDDRDFGQRQADGLEAIAKKILSLPDTTPGAHVPPQVSFLLTETTWHAATTELARRRAALQTFGLPLDPDADDNAHGDGNIGRGGRQG